MIMSKDFLYMVSVAVTTYNMEQYVAEMLDSILVQKTSFPYEIIISDDGSEDRTCEIVRNYQQMHDNIRLISTGHIGKMPNFIRSLQESHGKYVALCDGDDYWIDENKLQMQFDFMEAHPDFSACWTNSWVLDVEKDERKIAKTHVWDEATTEGLLSHRDDDNIQMSPGHTSAYFYRNGLVKEYPRWMYGDVMTDFPLYMQITRYGKAKFINIPTSVYRHTNNGISSRGWEFTKAIRRRIFVYENVNRDFKYQYKSIINPILGDYYWNLGKFIFKNVSKLQSLSILVKALVCKPSLFYTILN